MMAIFWPKLTIFFFLRLFGAYALFDGLPPLSGTVSLQPRPDHLIPSPSFWFDHETFIQKSFHF